MLQAPMCYILIATRQYNIREHLVFMLFTRTVEFKCMVSLLLFQGTLTNETRCLNCETVRTKDEDFLDLSVDIKQYTSITNCLQCFSNTETIQSENKYYCEVCRCKQEAQKR